MSACSKEIEEKDRGNVDAARERYFQPLDVGFAANSVSDFIVVDTNTVRRAVQAHVVAKRGTAVESCFCESCLSVCVKGLKGNIQAVKGSGG